MESKYQRRYEKRKAAGSCVKCGGLRDIPTSLTCSKCYNKKKLKEKINTLNGRCVCGELIEKGWACRECKNKRREYSYNKLQLAKEKGLCYNCDKPHLPERMNCEEHTLKAIARQSCGNALHWVYIQNLLAKQNNQCKYCKINISLANNGELDHIQPKIRFSELKFEPSNWQWLCEPCNAAKSDMTEEEFFAWATRLLEGI